LADFLKAATRIPVCEPIIDFRFNDQSGIFSRHPADLKKALIICQLMPDVIMDDYGDCFGPGSFHDLFMNLSDVICWMSAFFGIVILPVS